MCNQKGMGLFATVVALMVASTVVEVWVAAVQVVAGRGTAAWAVVVWAEAGLAAVVMAVAARVTVARVAVATGVVTEAGAMDLEARAEVMVGGEMVAAVRVAAARGEVERVVRVERVVTEAMMAVSDCGAARVVVMVVAGPEAVRGVELAEALAAAHQVVAATVVVGVLPRCRVGHRWRRWDLQQIC